MEKLKRLYIEDKNNRFPYLLSILATTTSLTLTQITTNISLWLILLLWLIFTTIIVYIALRTLPRIDLISGSSNEDLNNKINERMIEILKSGGNCLISTRDFTWGVRKTNSEIYKTLVAKSKDNELIILIPKKVYNKMQINYKQNIDTLNKHGAHIFKYSGDHIGHSFTITNFTSKNDQTIAVAQRGAPLSYKHTIHYKDEKQNKLLFSILTETIKAIV